MNMSQIEKFAVIAGIINCVSAVIVLVCQLAA